MSEGRGPLEGIRVVDVSRVLAGPFCTMILGDLGAEVIKVEAPGGSDDTRGWGPPYAAGESAYYLCTNRNKRGITLDLKKEEGKRIFLRLIREADVLVENFKVGTLARMGLAPERLRKINPRLVVAEITGFGQTGPLSSLPGYDFIIQALGGLMSITGSEESGPMKVGVAIVDVLAGLLRRPRDPCRPPRAQAVRRGTDRGYRPARCLRGFPGERGQQLSGGGQMWRNCSETPTPTSCLISPSAPPIRRW